MLGELIELRDRYGLTPERIAEQLVAPGQVQDDRLDELRSLGRERVARMETVLQVVRALTKADEGLQDEYNIWMLSVGMLLQDEEDPSEDEITEALHFLPPEHRAGRARRGGLPTGDGLRQRVAATPDRRRGHRVGDRGAGDRVR